MRDFQATTRIKALRKARQCYWCQEGVPGGCSATKVVGVWEGAFSAMYVHPECETAWANDPCTLDGDVCIYEHRRGKTCGENEKEPAVYAKGRYTPKGE